MPGLRSILSLLALGSVMVDNPMPQRVIANAIRVVALVVFSTLLTGALLIAAIAFGYHWLMHEGYSQSEAAMYAIGFVAVLTVIVIGITVHHAKNLLTAIGTSTKKHVPLPEHLANQATDVVGAFVEGFLSKYNQK